MTRLQAVGSGKVRIKRGVGLPKPAVLDLCVWHPQRLEKLHTPSLEGAGAEKAVGVHACFLKADAQCVKEHTIVHSHIGPHLETPCVRGLKRAKQVPASLTPNEKIRPQRQNRVNTWVSRNSRCSFQIVLMPFLGVFRPIVQIYLEGEVTKQVCRPRHMLAPVQSQHRRSEISKSRTLHACQENKVSRAIRKQCSVKTQAATGSTSSRIKQQEMLHKVMTYRMLDTSSNRIKQKMAVIMAACCASTGGETSTWPQR